MATSPAPAPLPAASTAPAEEALLDAAEPEEEAAVESREGLVDAAGHGQRLDRWLVGMAPEFSRSHLQTLVEAGHVQVDGVAHAVSSRKLRIGQRVRLELVPTAASQAFRPETMVLDIVYEDEALLVVNKRAGLVVHPAAGNWSGTLLNGLLAHHAGAATLPRAGIVHRLDKDTSGLMVVAKTLPAMTALVRSIAAREVRRIYLALCHGEPRWDQQCIEAPIGRDPVSRVRMAVQAQGKPARTDVACLARWQGIGALRCKLHTGRTHQIRVHLAHLGHPLLADGVYGGRAALGLTRQALHAAELAFMHPLQGTERSFSAPLPPDLAAAWQQVTTP